MILIGVEIMRNYSYSRSAIGIFFMLAAAAFATLISACSSDEKVIEGELVAETDKNSGTLILYSGRSESLIGNIVEQFEDASGIDVKVKYGKTFPIAAMILEEGKNSPADIFLAQDPGGLGFLSAEGRL